MGGSPMFGEVVVSVLFRGRVLVRRVVCGGSMLFREIVNCLER